MDDFNIALSRFLVLPSVAGSSDAIYGKALTAFHGRESHTETEWRQLIEAIKSRPLAPTTLRAAAPNPPRTARRR